MKVTLLALIVSLFIHSTAVAGEMSSVPSMSHTCDYAADRLVDKGVVSAQEATDSSSSAVSSDAVQSAH